MTAVAAPAGNVPPLDPALQQRGGSPDLLFAELVGLITAGLNNAPRELQTALGPSEIGDPCSRRIGHKLLGTPPRALPPNWKAGLGTWAHAGLAGILDADNVRCAPDLGYHERWLVETRVDVGHGITGTVDAYDFLTATEVDFKTCGRAMLRKYKRFGPGAAYQIQGHLYGLGLTRAGHPVDTVSIVFLPRQGELSEAFYWHEPFDPDLAEAALQRYDGIRALVEVLGENALDALPKSPEYCTHCPFYQAGCDGHPDARPPLAEPAITYNERPHGYNTV